MRKNKIVKPLVVVFLVATLFGSTVAFSVKAAEIMLMISLVVVALMVILLVVKPYFNDKKR